MVEYKLSRKKYRPNHLLSYKCPLCNKAMGCEIVLCQPYEIWSCDYCKKSFELTFRELEPKTIVKDVGKKLKGGKKK